MKSDSKTKRNSRQKIFRYIAFGFTLAANLIGNMIALAYAISTIGLAAGMALSLLSFASNIVVGIIVDYNTTITKEKNSKTKKCDPQNNAKKNGVSPGLFLAIVIPAMVMSSISIFIGSYKSSLLLFAALSLTAAPVILTACAIAIGSIMALSALMYAIIHATEVYQRIHSSVKLKNGSASTQLISKTLKSNLPNTVTLSNSTLSNLQEPLKVIRPEKLPVHEALPKQTPQKVIRRHSF